MEYTDKNGNTKKAKVIYLRPHNYCDKITKWEAENCSEEEAKKICKKFNDHYSNPYFPSPTKSYEIDDKTGNIIFTERDPYDD